jgi:hypothetical protein
MARGQFDVSLGSEPPDPSILGNPPYTIASAGGLPKDIVTELPPGFIGNPTAVPQCTVEQFEFTGCPPSSQIGVVRTLWGLDEINSPTFAVYNMVPPANAPAQLAFSVQGYKITGTASVRSDGDYGIVLSFKKLPEVIQPLRVRLDVFGEPADPEIDKFRCQLLNPAVDRCNGFTFHGSPSVLAVPRPYVGPNIPFLSNPTNCADPVLSDIHLSLWNDPAPTEDFGIRAGARPSFRAPTTRTARRSRSSRRSTSRRPAVGPIARPASTSTSTSPRTGWSNRKGWRPHI